MLTIKSQNWSWEVRTEEVLGRALSMTMEYTTLACSDKIGSEYIQLIRTFL